MDPTESKKKRKVAAERTRRTEINQRVEQVRHLLGLNEQLTRIQVLKKAADVTHELLRNPTTNPKPVSAAASLWLEPRQLVKMGMTKALIEKYRRQLERRELNRVRGLLGAEQKSDISLLDDLIHLFQSLLNDSHLQPSSDHHRYRSKSPARRCPLRMVDMNISNSDRKQLTVKQRPAKNLRTTGDSTARDSYWRPWEM
ncbi:hypothetical protein FBUS_06301 [Fasciolopsis buskii]|uniref:BHLH domain-containing protein n=1 Tax=Fasciolopsis buskii TaxID=27845 RepID=A0A8E0RVN3_9TREM|nr:hypothetical protein FBUS_06301 [Fasciolopsis buski]